MRDTGFVWVLGILESPGNLQTLVIIFFSIIFGFLFCKGLLLQLLCIWESEKSWKIPGNLILKNSMNPDGTSSIWLTYYCSPIQCLWDEFVVGLTKLPTVTQLPLYEIVSD